jgi:hypothetical protein
MLSVTVKITCENAAFADDCEGEVARLLKQAAKKVEAGELERLGYIPLMDINGNKVGSVEIERE